MRELRTRGLGVGAWLLGASLMVSAAWGQGAKAGAGATFEVASVRLSPPGGDGMTSWNLYDGPRVTFRNTRLTLLLQVAFGVEDYQIAGVPSWAETTNFDINAKAEGDTALTYEQLKPLLQQLLVERLHLKVHRAMKDFKGYALVVAKGGAKLHASIQPKGGGGVHAQILTNGLQASPVSLDMFASMVGHAVHRPVVNKTGIAGEYTIDLAYAPEGATDSTLPSLFTALQETMGLRLETQMVPVEMLVVDGVEKVPVEN